MLKTILTYIFINLSFNFNIAHAGGHSSSHTTSDSAPSAQIDYCKKTRSNIYDWISKHGQDCRVDGEDPSDKTRYLTSCRIGETQEIANISVKKSAILKFELSGTEGPVAIKQAMLSSLDYLSCSPLDVDEKLRPHRKRKTTQ